MDLRKLKTLIDLVSEYNIYELEITEAEGKVRIVKAGLVAPAPAVALPLPVAAAPVAAPAAAPAVAAAPAAATHTVVAGDTLGAISARHGADLNAVLAVNGLSLASIIFPGDSIVIPTGGAVQAPAQTVSVPVAVAPAAPVQQAAAVAPAPVVHQAAAVAPGSGRKSAPQRWADP